MSEDRVVITNVSEDEKLGLLGYASQEIRRVIPKGMRFITIDIDMPEQVDRVYIELVRAEDN